MNGSENNIPIAVICVTCAQSFRHNRIQKNSTANKVDFGIGSKIGLEYPSIQELHIISYVQYYYNIIKIKSKGRCLCEHQQSAIRELSIFIEHDAPQVVTNLLSPETMNSNVFVHFVGRSREFDSLCKKTTQSKSADDFGRSWVVYQWLSVKHAIDPYHQNLLLASFF